MTRTDAHLRADTRDGVAAVVVVTRAAESTDR
jgi:hypothetical protein